MAKIISIVNFKGGVGKTTITVNLAAALAKLQSKTCIAKSDYTNSRRENSRSNREGKRV